VKLANAEVLRSHEGGEGTSGLSNSGRFGGRSRLLDLINISDNVIRSKGRLTK
jgi:hypothetical protein